MSDSSVGQGHWKKIRINSVAQLSCDRVRSKQQATICAYIIELLA